MALIIKYTSVTTEIKAQNVLIIVILFHSIHFFKICQMRQGSLNFKALIYFCINHGDQRFFQFEIIINVSASLFRFIRIPVYVMALRPL